MGPVVGLVLVGRLFSLFLPSLTSLAQVFVGVFTIYLATFNYLADSYTIYASSALSKPLLLRRAGPDFALRSQVVSPVFGISVAQFSHFSLHTCTRA